MLNKHPMKTCIGIALIIFALDQLSKALVIYTLSEQSVAILPHLNLSLAYNRGAAFGMLANAAGWQIGAFIAMAVLTTLIILPWSRRLRLRDKVENIALALILGGAWGNLFDRICYAHVIDFIDFYIGDWHWYTFNIADASICIGAVLLVFVGLRKSY